MDRPWTGRGPAAGCHVDIPWTGRGRRFVAEAALSRGRPTLWPRFQCDQTHRDVVVTAVSMRLDPPRWPLLQAARGPVGGRAQVFAHGNFQPDNARFLADDDGSMRVQAFDWGNAGFAPAPVAFMGLFNGIPYDVYRADSERFFRTYCDTLRAGCGRHIAWDELRDAYPLRRPSGTASRRRRGHDPDRPWAVARGLPRYEFAEATTGAVFGLLMLGGDVASRDVDFSDVVDVLDPAIDNHWNSRCWVRCVTRLGGKQTSRWSGRERLVEIRGRTDPDGCFMRRSTSTCWATPPSPCASPNWPSASRGGSSDEFSGRSGRGCLSMFDWTQPGRPFWAPQCGRGCSSMFDWAPSAKVPGTSAGGRFPTEYPRRGRGGAATPFPPSRRRRVVINAQVN